MPHANTVHFIAGLPRSGSTLLSALLAQNPAIVTSGRSSPVAPMMLRVASLMAEGDYAGDFDAAKRDRVMRRLLESYYAITNPQQIVIDTHRDWCARMGLIDAVFPQAKVICCVRDPIWILDSLERLIVRDPVLSSNLVPLSRRATQHDRLEYILSPEGVFGYAWRVLNEAFHGPYAHRLILVDYDYLARAPCQAMDSLTRALGLPPHDYDPDHVVTPDTDKFDQALGTPGLHAVRPRVTPEPRRSILPPAIRERLEGGMFWRSTQARESGALILC
ncbi:sulfotransferase family protein [Asaia bogorensis]|uniref:sulfotransferase family protein n=1 Tax=Asaia bogorensis TaxID=91915 RepID=UPI0028615EB9|nr:sulfotransferase [Asaia bogorensis]MDR6183963.1 sulfotransferase [Asaia bogorensis NBRC 16594]